MSMKKLVLFAFKFGMVGALFTLIFRPEWLGFSEGLFGGVKVVDVLREMRKVSGTGWGVFVFWMACATAVKLLGILCGILRWKLLLRGQGLRMPFGLMAYQWFLGRAAGLVMPGTTGLDGVRLIESSRYTRDPIKCATVIAIEKLTAIISLSLLVFATFPLGFRYLKINAPMLAVIMAVLACGVVGSLLLLLNPRIIQVCVAVIPLPGKLRRIVNRLGDAVTAYAGSRMSLLLAVLFGVGVHLGICACFQCTFMAIRAQNASVADIFFVGPLMITASILAFTVSGLGVREVAFGLVLGPTAGTATAILGGHLELWAGEIIPFVLSIPLLLLGGGLRDKARADAAELASIPSPPPSAAIPPDKVAEYRRKMAATLAASGFGGLLAGMTVALAEALWLRYSLGSGIEDTGLFVWGPAAYGLCFAGIGLGIGAGLVFLYLLLDRFAGWAFSFAASAAAVLGLGAAVIGLFRYQRDVLAGHALTQRDLAMVACIAGAVTLFCFVSAYVKAAVAGRITRQRALPLLVLGVAGWALVLGIGAVLGKTLKTEVAARTFAPKAKAAGPNIILCAADALRADYLRVYSPEAKAATPAMDAFAKDAVTFRQAFAQASWTKPSFGTIFTGRYPEAHRATTKTGMLSAEIPTLAGALSDAGYYARGFANNPNIMTVFGFDRGFSDYTDLKPEPLFGASDASMRLALYQVMRKVFLTAEGKVRRGRLRITDFYQPAETVTDEALRWVDSGARPKDAPFYLFLHYMDTHDPFMDYNNPGVGYARARMEHPDPDKYLDKMRNAYVSDIEHLDTHLARLLDGLKQRGLYDNTLIVFTADHGEEFFDHNGWWHGQTLYNEVVQVPLIVKLPGNARAGESNGDLARLIDLAPTMLQFAGQPPVSGMSGQPLFDGQGNFSNAGIAWSYAENDFEDNILQAVRSGENTLIHANEENPRGTKPVELYDRRADPAEKANLAGKPELAETQQQLDKVLADYRRASAENAPEPAAPAQMDAATVEQLKAIGYLK